MRSRDRLLDGVHVLRHLVHAGSQADHRRDDLALLVAQVLLEPALDDRDRFVGVRCARDERLLHQHTDLGQLPILRLLQLLQLVLQLRDIALQFLDFLACAGRLRTGANASIAAASTATTRKCVGTYASLLDRERTG